MLVKLSSPGPVFYAAKRLGYQGRTISVYKFRTMFSDADEQLERMLSESCEHAAQWSSRYKLDNDPRVTRLGRFLRKSSLDELPQLWNVLKGDMSLVGPRPIREAEVAKYGDNYALLKSVRPGMTGLWQVSGRSTLSYEERVALDIRYIKTRTVWLDISILLRTIPEVLSGKGAF